MQLANTLMFVWTPNGRLPLLNGASPTMYTGPISTDGADQIGLLVATTPAGSGTNAGTDANVYLRVAWAGQLPGSTAPSVFVEECIETTGSLVGGVQRYGLSPKEYGPILTGPGQGARATIWLPTAVHYFKIGCYADANATGSASVTVFVERAWTGDSFQQAR